jgi:hypothetical protein
MEQPRRLLALLLSISMGVIWCAAALPALAIQYGSGLYGVCQYGSCSISISSSTSVAVNVTPTASGSCTIQKDAVAVSTDNSAGYNLSFANSSTNTALVNGGSIIPATAATQASPASLTVNHWGYRVDGIGGFGAGPTSAQSNVAVSAAQFAGVPASNGTAAVLATTASKANPAVTTNVWYGVCANTSTASGTYTAQITYTAVAN